MARKYFICQLESCDSMHYSKGYCKLHYNRWRNTGNPLQRFGSTEADPILRFWSRVALTANDTRCWIFGKLTSPGYGHFRAFGRQWVSHQFAWFVTHGYKSSMILRHTCDTPRCVNPKHLLEGTAKDNTRDAVERNRNVRGERHPLAKLTEADVRLIRELRQSGISQREIAKQVKVGLTRVRMINNRTAWVHVT